MFPQKTESDTSIISAHPVVFRRTRLCEKKKQTETSIVTVVTGNPCTTAHIPRFQLRDFWTTVTRCHLQKCVSSSPQKKQLKSEVPENLTYAANDVVHASPVVEVTKKRAAEATVPYSLSSHGAGWLQPTGSRDPINSVHRAATVARPLSAREPDKYGDISAAPRLHSEAHLLSARFPELEVAPEVHVRAGLPALETT